MFTRSDLKKTRFYQEVFAEGQAEAKQRENAAILRMYRQGLATDQIATFLDLPIAEVEATIAQATQEQN